MYSSEIHRGTARLRQTDKDEKLCKRILTTMGGDGPQRVVLAGVSGIGKTRLARNVGKYATKEGLCYLTLWLNLNEKFEDQWSLYENIAFQIKAYDRDDKREKDKENFLQDLKHKISAEINNKKRSAEEHMRRKMRSSAGRKVKWLPEIFAKNLEAEDSPTEEKRNVMPYILLIFDDEGNQTREDKVMKDLGLELFLKDYAPLKILITRKQSNENTTKADGETESHDMEDPQDTRSEEENESHEDTRREEELESHDMDDPQDIRSEEQIESHATRYETRADTKNEGECVFYTTDGHIPTTDESQTLLRTLTKENMQDLFASLINDEAMELLVSLEKSWKIDKPLIYRVVHKSRYLPAAIVMLAKSLSCITNNLSPKQEKVLKEFLSLCEPPNTVPRCYPILQLAYQLLETDDTLKNAIFDCFWHSVDLFKHCGCIHYNELITHWMLEGYFDPVRSIEKSYKDGHEILLGLINRGILKVQEGDMVVPEMAMSELTDPRHQGLLGRSRLRFARVYGGDKKKGLGKITQLDGMIKTVQENMCTILAGGNRLRREQPDNFFKQMKDLEVLGLFDPILLDFIQSVSVLSQLRVLVIRDYDLLPSMEELKGLRRLEVLEVSGASSVETISDDFFEALPKLQSLNLSGLRIISSPSSISQLKYLRSLILRDCLLLEDFPDIQHLDMLEVVDVRGARKLKTFFEENTSKNRTFSRLKQLVLLDLSESKLKRLPIFEDVSMGEKLHSLTRLSLHNCSSLVKLPNLKPLSGLQIVDLSSTTSLVEIAEVCFEDKEELKILDLSGTKFTKLPYSIFGLSNLRQLLLRDGFNLEAVPNIKGLTSLEVFDVSGCTKLHKIEGSFKDMSYLHEVNLSRTRIETLPELPEKSSMGCSKLVVLADSKRVIHDTWSQVKEAIRNRFSESLSSSDTVDGIQETSRKELGSASELWAFDCPEKKSRRREHFYQGHIYMDVYMNTIPFVDTKICQDVLEIQGSNGVDPDKETLAKVEFVAIVDNSTAGVSSIFNDLKSVKGCWLEMCGDIVFLFSGVAEERLGNLETLSITNFRRLENICSSSFKNLKNLNLDCCPHIKTLIPASALPTSLEVLKIKFCEKLEKVFEQEVKVPNLHTLCLFKLPMLYAINAMLPNLNTYNKEKCPKLETSKEDLCGLGSSTL